MRGREIKACDRCRLSKRRCDRTKPACYRCVHAGVQCSFNHINDGSTAADIGISGSLPLSSSLSQSTSRDESSVTPKEIGSSEQTDLELWTNTGINAKRRRRVCLSCQRCHRLKVKCDKKVPCSRCTASGCQKECSYTNTDSQTSDNARLTATVTFGPVAAAGEDHEQVRLIWQSRRRGSSHWSALMTRILSLCPLDELLLQYSHEETGNQCSPDLDMPGNFPFGSPDISDYASRANILALVDAIKPLYKTYIDNYFIIFNPVHPVLDIHVFLIEVDQYWTDPSGPTLSWLALFLMVLGLGLSMEPGESNKVRRFFMAAEACFMQTPFMFRPDLFSLRTFCLMVLAKQVSNTTCWGLDGCWTLLGLLVRLAIIYGLDEDVSQPSGMDEIVTEDSEARRRLWITIQYLDIKLSMTTGMPPHVQPGGMLTMHKSRRHQDEGSVNLWQDVLMRSFRTVCMMLSRLDSHTDELSYQEALNFNTAIRQFMDHNVSDPLTRTTLNLYFRRALLALHYPFATAEDAPSKFPESYWSSLECSLAVLICYRDLSSLHCCHGSLNAISGLFMLDLFIAVMTLCLHLLRHDPPFMQPFVPLLSEIPSRQTILDSLQSCREICAREKERSICYHKVYELLNALVDLVLEVPPNNLGYTGGHCCLPCFACPSSGLE